MPQRKSMAKRMRQALQRRARNRAVKSRVHTETKRALTAIAAGDREAAQQAAEAARRQIDKAVSKGVLHRRTAARRKSRLYRHLHSGTVPAQAPAGARRPDATTAEAEEAAAEEQA
jgi:small subunit ribosomal protein S20